MNNLLPLIYILPVNTRNTAGTGSGILWCAQVHYRTHTRATHFGNTVGIPVPVRNPNHCLPFPALVCTHLLSSVCSHPLSPLSTPALIHSYALMSKLLLSLSDFQPLILADLALFELVPICPCWFHLVYIQPCSFWPICTWSCSFTITFARAQSCLDDLAWLGLIPLVRCLYWFVPVCVHLQSMTVIHARMRLLVVVRALALTGFSGQWLFLCHNQYLNIYLLRFGMITL
jgi:hypothetical protein